MNNKKFFKTVLNTFFTLMSALAIGQKMNITGTVTDANGPLPSATVYLKGTSNGVTTDFDGVFSILNSAQGSQVLVVSYIGYKSKEIPLDIPNSNSINLGIILIEEDAESLSEVVIKGNYYPSQVRALNMKRKGVTISEVLAADAIGKLPDRNAAEAVQRMQGVSIERDMGEGRRVIVRGAPTHWTAITLNGNRLPSAGGASDERYTQLDVFPSELIQYVQLNKALTPNIDGDAIGGTMNFITKSSPLKQTLSVTAAGGYNTNTKDPSYNASLVYGDRIGEKFGFIGSAVIWDRQAGTDRYDVDYDFSNPDNTQSFAINRLQLRDYQARRKTAGFNLAMDYDLAPSSKLYFKGLYSNYLDQQTVRETYFNFNQNNVQYQARHADYKTNLYSLKFGGDFKLSDQLVLEAALQTASSNFKLDSPNTVPEADRGYPVVNFIQPMTYGGLSSDGLKYLAMDSPNGVGGSLDHVTPNFQSDLDPSKAYLNQIIMSGLDKEETDYTGNFDFTYTKDEKLELKFGGKYAGKSRDYNSYTALKMQGALIGIPNMPGVVFMSDLDLQSEPFDGTFLEDMGNTYSNVNIPQVTNNQIDQMFTEDFASQNGLITLLDKDDPINAPQSYTAKEEVASGYIMADYKWTDKIEIIGGIRNESNYIKLSGAKVVTDESGSAVESITTTQHYNAFLPMLHLKYKFSDNALLRTAYTRTYARPTFSRLNPGTQISEIDLTITEGNPDLKATFSNNFDVMFEFYPEGLGLFSAGAYYKGLSDYIYDDQSLVSLNGTNYIRTRPDTIESAWLYGIELSIIKRFDNSNTVFKNFGVELNYSYINSEVEIPTFTNGEETGSYKTTLPGQAKNIGNVILFYENNKFMARVAGNLKGKYVTEIRSVAGPEHYRWFDNNFTVDFSSSYSISDNLRLFAEINNITNSPNRFYHGTSDRPEQDNWSGIRGQIGLSYNLN
ncbi:TonB-dependent receptor [Formosa haliotis]|uniref:TonB-dependent receptor n=1 Tax=Formosa haliotis TaxID=1555194 RepID=UPI0008262A4D|nr:TonB-dependent receptor [Formosa haliotis]